MDQAAPRPTAHRPVRKAVIPAAGLGTRFLPATKAIPKEMLPVVDRPTLQYVIEEAVRAGIEDILVITGRSKRALEDHFDRAPELEEVLSSRHKDDQLREVVDIVDLANIHFIRQPEALGLGHAVSLARHHVGDEPFAVLLADEFWLEGDDILPDMIATHEATGGSVIALLEVEGDDVARYGCADVTRDPGDPDRVVRIQGLVEKPAPEDAPSNLCIMGRYVLTPDVFAHLEVLTPGAGGELQLTDALAAMIREQQPMLGWTFKEGRRDTGQVLDYLKVVVDVALAREDLGPELRRFLAERIGDAGV